MIKKYKITKKEEVIRLLKGKRNFEYMSDTMLRRLIETMKVIRFEKEVDLLRQGQESSMFYIIIKGKAQVYVDGEFVYKLQRTGDVFGEVSFVTRSVATATIRTEKDLGVIGISYRFLEKMADVEFCMWLCRIMAEKLVRTSKLKVSGSQSQSQGNTPVQDMVASVGDSSEPVSPAEEEVEIPILDLTDSAETESEESTALVKGSDLTG